MRRRAGRGLAAEVEADQAADQQEQHGIEDYADYSHIGRLGLEPAPLDAGQDDVDQEQHGVELGARHKPE
jgi:hypothetical protein